jgi:hypothetical protein
LTRLREHEAERRQHSERNVALDAEIAAAQERRDGLLDQLDELRERRFERRRLTRSANQLGGSWRDVASSLRLTEDAARRAYDRPRPS